MFEHLTDSNILQSSKTYGRKKVCRSISISSESSGSFSASTSEDLKSNGILQFKNNNEYLHSEESSDFVAKILGNYEHSTFQKSTVTDHKFSLYTEEDMLFHYASDKLREQSSSITDFSSSGSNYQRTRKNQKNRLSIQQYDPEELSESTYTFDIKPSTSVTNSKSTSNFLSSKQASAKQNCHIPKDSQIIHKKTNGVKSNDTCTNLTQKPNLFKSGLFFNKGTVSQNPLNNQKSVSILDLVNRYAANNKQDNGKNNLSKKRTKNKEACESIPAKKFNKSSVIKSDIITAVSYLNNVNKNIIKTSPKAAQPKNPKYVDNVERSKDITGSVSNLSAFRQGDIKTLSKSVEVKKCISVDNALENISSIGKVTHLSTLKKSIAETQSKAIQKKTYSSFNSSEKKLGSVDKPITPKKRNKMVSKIVQKKNSISPNNAEKSIAICKKYVSKKKPVELIQSNYDVKQIEELPFEQSAECIVRNQTHNLPNVNVGVNYGLNMPIIIAPMPPISQGTSQVISLGIWKTVPFDTNLGPSLLSDPSSMNASCSNLKDLEFGSDMYFMRKKTNATTIINNSSFNCNKQKKIIRPRTLIIDGLEFRQQTVNTLKTIEDHCILHSKEQSSKIFLNNPALLDVTVREFCNHNEVTDFLLDYLTGIDMKKYLNGFNTNKGYDFPENFETENLLRVIKDFVHTTISYIVPANVSISLDIPLYHIIKCATQKMSNNEVSILMQVFGEKEKVLKLKDVLSRLSLVALFVIFDEYKKKLR